MSKVLRVGGKDPTGNLIGFNADEAGNILVGERNIEVVKFFDDLVITDTTHHVSPLIDVSKYKKITWIAYTSLDQPVKICPQFGYSLNSHVFRNGNWELVSSDMIPQLEPTGHPARRVLNPALPELDLPIHTLRWVATCIVAPTSGTLTIEAWGLPN